jgi:hypothetical protein
MSSLSPFAAVLIWDADGNVTGTVEFLVQTMPDDSVQVVDLVAHDEAGTLGDIIDAPDAAGMGAFPLFIGSRAHEYRVDVAAGKVTAGKVTALVHRSNGNRIERDEVEARVEARLAEAEGDEPVNLTDVIGSPFRPLHLTLDGKLRQR